MLIRIAEGTFIQFSWEYGIWNVRILGYGIQLKAPWARITFHERYNEDLSPRISCPKKPCWRIRRLKHLKGKV